eukprot:COSAG05_NODE_20264_length_281_cov_0.571429_1_plen_57_part_01
MIGINYGLIELNSFQPAPSYYVAVLFHRLMATRVLRPPTQVGITVESLRMYHRFSAC